MKLKINPDKNKAEALLNMARVTKERLDKTEKIKYPGNTLTDYYDILHKLMETLSCLKGVKFKGDGAHQELIDFICKEYNFHESDRLFSQQLRDFRNKISYEGLDINQEYLIQNDEKIQKLTLKLRSLISEADNA